MSREAFDPAVHRAVEECPGDFVARRLQEISGPHHKGLKQNGVWRCLPWGGVGFLLGLCLGLWMGVASAGAMLADAGEGLRRQL